MVGAEPKPAEEAALTAEGLSKASKEALPVKKPQMVKKHFRDMIILQKIMGSTVRVYNGKTFNQVDPKPEMIGYYLGSSPHLQAREAQPSQHWGHPLFLLHSSQVANKSTYLPFKKKILFKGKIKAFSDIPKLKIKSSELDTYYRN